MGRPTGGYTNKAGKRIPGTTTILSRYKESGGLIHWAWQQGRDGKDYRETRDAAANAGTCVHDMVECDIRAIEFQVSAYTPEILARAEKAFAAYREWKRQTNLQPFKTEVSLVSEVYQFGGTLDALLVQGCLSLGDWKSANSIYPDNLLQLAAYKILWEEHFPDQPITGGFHLLRFNKPDHEDDPIQFSHHFWDQLDLAKDQFLLYRRCYENESRLKRMI